MGFCLADIYAGYMSYPVRLGDRDPAPSSTHGPVVLGSTRGLARL